MTSFSSLLCHLLLVSLVDVCYDGDDHVERIVDVISLSEPVFDEGRQVLVILN